VAVQVAIRWAVRDTPPVKVLASPLAVSPVLLMAPAQKAHHLPRALRPFVQHFQVVSPQRIFLFVNFITYLHHVRTLTIDGNQLIHPALLTSGSPTKHISKQASPAQSSYIG